jgi:two-component system response regulator AtoC
MELAKQLFVGESPPIQKVKRLIPQVANTDLNVIISGESGVGKELVAQALHLMSRRMAKPFIKVNCAAIPDELLESELFGYERGAFTGAYRRKAGKFELAHGGTIFLDEIAEMSTFLQSKLLQVLQDFQFARLGAKNDINVDCWVLTATNHNLEKDVEEGRFREDLYYRLNIIRIFVPPLRERPADIRLLIDHFAGQISPKGETQGFRFPDHVRDFLCQYSWPGNVRELKNTVERLMILRDWSSVKKELIDRERSHFVCHESTTHPPDSPPNEMDSKAQPKKKFPALKEVKQKAIQEAEYKLISEVLEETNWNRKRSAELLQISYKAFLYKLKGLSLRQEN